jgi:serine/threonine-protein kinase
MAEVWRGEDEVLGRSVAVKLIDPALLDDPGFRSRFRAEARAAAGLSHPNVVVVHDYGEEDGTPYIVMELLDGETLAHRLSRGPVPSDQARSVCGQIAAALTAAHEAGVVHRDVKPGNVFLTRRGVKVLDFGVAGQAESGPVMGTPAYLAPEQLDRGPVTAAADVFALGVVLYETLTGSLPFVDPDGRPGSLPPLPPDTPADLAELGERCLSADPGDRPSAADAAAALDTPHDAAVALDTPHEAAPYEAASSAPTPTATQATDVPEPDEAFGARPRTAVLPDAVLPDVVPPEAAPPVPAGVRRRRLLAAGGAVAVVALVIAVVLANGGGDRPREPGPTSPVASPSAPVAAPTPNGAVAALTQMRQVVDEGAAAGQVRADVALDFDNLLSDLLGKLAAGRPVDVAGQVALLRTKIEQRLREGGLTADRAGELRAALAGIR